MIPREVRFFTVAYEISGKFENSPKVSSTTSGIAATAVDYR